MYGSVWECCRRNAAILCVGGSILPYFPIPAEANAAARQLVYRVAASKSAIRLRIKLRRTGQRLRFCKERTVVSPTKVIGLSCGGKQKCVQDSSFARSEPWYPAKVIGLSCCGKQKCEQRLRFCKADKRRSIPPYVTERFDAARLEICRNFA